MWSNLRVFRREGGFAWIERRSLRDAQLTELKKICRLLQSHHCRQRRSGSAGSSRLPVRAPRWRRCSPPCPTLPPRWSAKAPLSLLWFEHPGERFLLVTDVDTANRVTDALRGEAQFNNSQQWLALNIEAGLPVIDSANSGQFIPQATNLQALGGISFKRLLHRPRKWSRGRNSAAPISARCGRCQGPPAGCRKPGKTGAEDGRQLAPHRYGAGSRTAG